MNYTDSEWNSAGELPLHHSTIVHPASGCKTELKLLRKVRRKFEVTDRISPLDRIPDTWLENEKILLNIYRCKAYFRLRIKWSPDLQSFLFPAEYRVSLYKPLLLLVRIRVLWWGGASAARLGFQPLAERWSQLPLSQQGQIPIVLSESFPSLGACGHAPFHQQVVCYSPLSDEKS